MLATLYKDERCQQLSCFNILEKMYLDRLIKRTELTEFETLLQVFGFFCSAFTITFQDALTKIFWAGSSEGNHCWRLYHSGACCHWAQSLGCLQALQQHYLWGPRLWLNWTWLDPHVCFQVSSWRFLRTRLSALQAEWSLKGGCRGTLTR